MGSPRSPCNLLGRIKQPFALVFTLPFSRLLNFFFCFNRPRTPNKRKLNKQSENRQVNANTEYLKSQGRPAGKSLEDNRIQPSPSIDEATETQKCWMTHPGDPQPARETTQIQFPGLTPCSLTQDTKALQTTPTRLSRSLIP